MRFSQASCAVMSGNRPRSRLNSSTAYERLLPPFVAAVREEVKAWRDTNYFGASPTSRALLSWWFETGHLIEQADGSGRLNLTYAHLHLDLACQAVFTV